MDVSEVSEESWQKYFVDCVRSKPFVTVKPINDMPEMWAHTSAERYIDYYCHGGCARSWTVLSMIYKPKRIVEFGTAIGIRTNLLAILNPQAYVLSIDNQVGEEALCVPMGFLAKHNSNVYISTGNSWDFKVKDVDMCFVDADHSKLGVLWDSYRAWLNRNKEGDWCIVWDDYSLESVRQAVNRFVKEVNCKLEHSVGLYFIGTKSITLKGGKWYVENCNSPSPRTCG